MTPAPPGTPLWWLRTAAVDLVTLDAVASSEHPDGTVVDVASLPLGHVPRGPRVVRARVRPTNRRLVEIVVHGEVAGDDAPAVVWREWVRRDLKPVEVHLAAYLHDDAARAAVARGSAPALPGAVLATSEVRRLHLTRADEVAVVRWNPATGRVRELFVDPRYRRRRVATSSLFAAEACAVARGWPCLWNDGGRTELGEALCDGVARWGVRRSWVRAGVRAGVRAEARSDARAELAQA